MSSKREKKLFLTLYCINNLKEPFITRIQKTLFIYTQEYDEKILMYVPNNYGANSFELLEEINFLVNNGFINEKKDDNSIKYYLNKKGNEILNNVNIQKKYEHEKSILLEIVKHVNSLGSQLVSYVYKWYSKKYTEKSLILNEVVERMNDDRKKDATRSIKILRERIRQSQNN